MLPPFPLHQPGLTTQRARNKMAQTNRRRWTKTHPLGFDIALTCMGIKTNVAIESHHFKEEVEHNFYFLRY